MGRASDTGSSPEWRERHVSELGEEFELAGRARQLDLMGAPPIPAEARAELLVIKSGLMFLCARPTGDVHGGTVTGEGLYDRDTRYVSEFRLSFGGTDPVLLSHAVESGYRAVVDATNPTIGDANGARVPQEMLHLRRTLLAAERLYCKIELHNYCPQPVTVPLALSLACDFADVFEVRGVRARSARGHAMPPKARRAGVVFGYRGEDALFRETVIEADRAPSALDISDESARLEWTCTLATHESTRVLVTISPQAGPRRPSRRSFASASRSSDRELEGLHAQSTRIDSDNKRFEDVVSAAMRDLHALVTHTPAGRLPAAGIPWFVAPFGRDSLWTSLETLVVNPQLARDTLRVLASHQATDDEAWRDAEPGKILHELRSGELAQAGHIPHTPYYGTVDATPLFVVLAASYYTWTRDRETIVALRPAIDRALEWIDRWGDLDGDGFVEYSRRSPAGLANQGWKDSEDAIVHADGTLACGPIALVEAQAYVYLAKCSIADVFEELGERERAEELRSQARMLREAFNDAFWDPDEGTFVLALDGRKRQVRSVTSNAGHALYCGIVERSKAQSLGERLMAPDMFSGWGVRTLSALSRAYNPMSYHNGSVWPHDNAIVCAGLKQYGLSRAALRIADAMLDVATRARDFRLAELYCGFDRTATSEIVSYPVACRPQAWAAAAPFMLLQTMLGLSASAPDATLRVIGPRLPASLGRISLHGLRIGDASVDLAFTRTADVTAFALLEQRGELSVTGAAVPH